MYYSILLALVAVYCYVRGAQLLRKQRRNWWLVGLACNVAVLPGLAYHVTLAVVTVLAFMAACACLLWAANYPDKRCRLPGQLRFDPPAREMLP